MALARADQMGLRLDAHVARAVGRSRAVRGIAGPGPDPEQRARDDLGAQMVPSARLTLRLQSDSRTINEWEVCNGHAFVRTPRCTHDDDRARCSGPTVACASS